MVLYDEGEAEAQAKQQVQQAVHIFRLQMDEVVEQVDEGLKNQGMNPEGRTILISLLKSRVLNKNIPLGNLATDRIRGRMLQLWLDLSFHLATEWYKYGIARSSRPLIRGMICDLAESVITRSELGREGKQLSQNSQIVEQTVREMKPTKHFYEKLLPRNNDRRGGDING